MRTVTRLIAFVSLALIVFVTSGMIAEDRPPMANSSAIPYTQDNVDVAIGEVIASGFTQPVQVTHAGDGTRRLFVVEQTGAIKIVQGGQVLATPFLDISAGITCCRERGLLGLAFHPDYERNGFLYVNYTRISDGATVVARRPGADHRTDLACRARSRRSWTRV